VVYEKGSFEFEDACVIIYNFWRFIFRCTFWYLLKRNIKLQLRNFKLYNSKFKPRKPQKIILAWGWCGATWMVDSSANLTPSWHHTSHMLENWNVKKTWKSIFLYQFLSHQVTGPLGARVSYPHKLMQKLFFCTPHKNFWLRHSTKFLVVNQITYYILD